MLKKVLQEMFKGNVHSRADLARRLGISEGLLSQMMEDLARKGYLAALETPTDCSRCSGCGGSKACNGCGSSEATVFKGWALTTKGLEAAKRYRQ
jgi:hypothetical protein